MKITPFTQQNRTQNRSQNAQPRTQAQPNFKGLIVVKVAGPIPLWERSIQKAVERAEVAAKTLRTNRSRQDISVLIKGEEGEGIHAKNTFAFFMNTTQGKTHPIESQLVKELEAAGAKHTDGELTPNTYSHLTFKEDLVAGSIPTLILDDPEKVDFIAKILKSINPKAYKEQRVIWSAKAR